MAELGKDIKNGDRGNQGMIEVGMEFGMQVGMEVSVKVPGGFGGEC